MATFQKRDDRWRAIIRKAGHPTTIKVFTKKIEAERWARKVEADIEAGRRQSPAAIRLDDVIVRYLEEMTTVRPPGRSKLATLVMLRRELGRVGLRELDAQRIVGFARRRLAQGAGPVTIGIDLSYLGTVLRYARGGFGIEAPVEAVADARAFLAKQGMVGRSHHRERRPSSAELAALYQHWHDNPRQQIPMADIVAFAVATAMRDGEICRLRWGDLDCERRLILVRDRKDPRRKQGNDMWVPLLPPARSDDVDPLALILRQERRCSLIFPYNAASVSTVFTRAVAKLGIEDLRFHDLRHEGVSRLFERGLAIQQVALVSGHRDWSQLRRYTQLRPEELIGIDANASTRRTSS